MCTLVVVERERHIVKTQKTSNETVYWVSNQVIEDDADIKTNPNVRRCSSDTKQGYECC